MDTISQLQQGKAAVFNGHGLPFELISRSLPELKKGEILVRTLYTTLCGSDIHTYCGRRQEPPNVVLGHEIVGDILWISDEHPHTDARGDTLSVGDRVTWSIFVAPSNVVAPRPDMPQKSANLFKYGHTLALGNDVFNGGLADYCILKENTALIKLSVEIPLKVAATISCAHATTMGALRIAGDVAGKRVMVFGMGLLGLSFVSMCREAGACWIGVVDNNPSRLAMATKFGADDLYNLPAKGAKHEWPDADVVVDMTGDAAAMQLQLESLAVGGVAVWIGAVFPNKPVEVDAQNVVRKLLQIRGLHNYNYEDFVNATIFIENNYKKYPFEQLVEKDYELNDIQQAFEFADTEKPVRVGIRF